MPLSDNELLEILNSYENILEDQISKANELDPNKILDITPVDQLSKIRTIKDSLTGGGGEVTGEVSVTNFPETQTVAFAQGSTVSINNLDLGTKIDSATMPTGGVGNLGWLSAIWKQLTDKLPALVGGKIPVDVASLNVTVDNANLEISNDAGNPIPISDAGGSITIDNSNLTSIDGKLPTSLGSKIEANSLSIVLASDSELRLVNDANNPLYVTGNNTQYADDTAKGTSTGTLVMGSDGTNIRAVSVSEDIDGEIHLQTSIIQDVNVVASNSTTSNLDAGATFTGTVSNTSGDNTIQVIVKADQNLLVSVQQSTDSTNWDVVDNFPVAANIGTARSIRVTATYFRITATNIGSSATTYLRLQSQLMPIGNVLPVTLGQKSVIDSLAVTLASNQRLEKNLPTTIFGELETIQDTPVVQVDFVYGANTQTGTITTTGSGTTTNSNSFLALSTTANANSSSLFTTRRQLKYRCGQGMKARFGGYFTTGVANSVQQFGVGDIQSGILVNGIGFGYNGTSFGIFYANNSSTTWYPKTSWNVDVCDGSGSFNNQSGFNLNPTLNNVYQVRYGFLSASNIEFYVENPADGIWLLVHTIVTANIGNTTNFQNPTFPLFGYVANTSNTSNIVLRMASLAGFIQGVRKMIGVRNTFRNNKSITAETNIFSIQNRTSINSVNNKGQIHLRQISLANSGNANCTLTVYRNTTLGGTPSFTNLDTNNSIAATDTAGTTITGGVSIYNMSVSNADSNTENVEDADIFINPGETLTFAVTPISGTQNVVVSAVWFEDI